jgi:hypothetical protein
MVGKVKLHGFILFAHHHQLRTGRSFPAASSRTLSSHMRTELEPISGRKSVRHLTNQKISLKNKDRLKAKSACHQSL